MKDIANFLFEVGMLSKTPRTGLRFLGSGSESVAEHILQTIYIGYTLCKQEPGLDELTVLKLCLIHDLCEARTGDMNYMYKKYVTVDEKKAVEDITESLPFGEEIQSLLEEFNARNTRESLIAHDADQISLLIQLKERGDLGNKYSAEWIAYAVKRLETAAGKKLAQAVLDTDWSHWWFQDKSEWWVNAHNGDNR